MIIQHTYLDLFSIFLSLIFYGPSLKEVKNCRNYNASGTFIYYFIGLRETVFFFLSYPTITDSRYYGHYIFPPGVSVMTGVGCTEGFGLRNKNFLNSVLKERFMNP